MATRMTFKSLELKASSLRGLNGPGEQQGNAFRDAFHAAISDTERRIQQKIHAFAGDSVKRSQQSLQQMQSKEAQQNAILRQYDAAAKAEKEWQAMVQTMEGWLSSTPSVPAELAQLVHHHFHYQHAKKSSPADIGSQFQRELLGYEVDQQLLQEVLGVLQQLGLPVLPDLQRTVSNASALFDKLNDLHIRGSRLLKSNGDDRERVLEADALVSMLSDALASPLVKHININDHKQMLKKLVSAMDSMQERLQQAEQSSKAEQDAVAGMLALFPYLAALNASQKAAKDFLAQQRGIAKELTDRGQLQRWNALRAVWAAPHHILSLDPNSSGPAATTHDSKMKIPMKYITKFVHLFMELLHEADAGQYAFLSTATVDSVLTAVKAEESEYLIQFYAAVLSGILLSVSDSKRKYWANLLAGGMQCDWTAPNLLTSSASAGTIDEKMNVFRLNAAVLAYSGNTEHMVHATGVSQGEISVAAAWQWLVRFIQQLSFIVHSTTHKSNTAGQLSANLACFLLHTYLRFTGHLLSLYQQDAFFSAISAALELVNLLPVAGNSRVQKCKEYLEKLHKERIAGEYYFNHQEPFVLSGLLLARSAEETHLEISALEANKTSEFMMRIKSHQMDRLRVIFNRLSVTKESQTTAIALLLQKIMIAHADSKEMLKYLLYKIVINVLRDCQEEFFNEMDEGQPMRLARLVVGLCKEMALLKEYFVGHFYRSCPVLIPYILPEGLGSAQSDVYLHSLGFIKKSENDSWEGNDIWLARMSKILAVFTVTAIQPEQLPFTVGHVFVYLSRLINSYASMTNPPFFAASFLEVVLRIAGARLYECYGQTFMKLLQVVQTAIVPKLEDKMLRKASLETFLKRFVTSKGKDFMSLFHKADE